MIGDSRFARLFQDEDFAVDETSREFQQLNPSTKVATSSNIDHERGLTAVEEEMIDEVPHSSAEDESSDNDGLRYGKTKNERVSSTDYKRRPNKQQKRRDKLQIRVTSSNGPVFNRRREQEQSFGSRALNLQSPERKRGNKGGVVGDKVITFEPGTSKKKMPRPNVDVVKQPWQDRRSASGNTFRRM